MLQQWPVNRSVLDQARSKTALATYKEEDHCLQVDVLNGLQARLHITIALLHVVGVL